MAATFSKILDEFSPTSENWIKYEERFKYCLVAHGITDAAQKKAHLIASIGPSMFLLLRSIASPKGIKEELHTDLAKLLREHFSPKLSEVAHRFKFNLCVCRPRESVATFVAQLRSLSEQCKFGDTLEIMIRDRLMFGINDKAFKKMVACRT